MHRPRPRLSDVRICRSPDLTSQPVCEGFFEFGCTSDTLRVMFKNHQLTFATYVCWAAPAV